jgi:UDP-N-acetyl-2-amino-2-deoxyglucuronate dehydrogenase
MTTTAVIGCGTISIVHFKAIKALPDCQLVAVCDTDPVTAAAMSEWHGVPAYASHHELLAAVRPDVVHIATPHDQHVQPAIDCLAAGVNVLVEKPVAHTMSEAWRLVEAAERPGSPKIGVCFQNRYNTTSRTMHARLRNGDLGTVLGASATVFWHRTEAYYHARPWRGLMDRGGGGVLINQAIHSLDLLQWLLGEVVDVSGFTGRLALEGVIDVEDSALLVLDHAGGARTVFAASNANAADSPVTMEIVTEKAELFLRHDLTISYADGRTETVAERRATSAGRAYWGVSHDLLIADFYARLAEPEPFWISPREAVKSLEILTRAYSSVPTGGGDRPAVGFSG